jgi:hypothetical protein
MRVRGLGDVREVLLSVGPREAKNLTRTVVFDIARQAATRGKANAPGPDQGTLVAATGVKRERGDKNTIRATVRVSGRAFYWRFLEYGDGPDKVEHGMFLRALQSMRPEMGSIYLETLARKLEARLARERKRQGRA